MTRANPPPNQQLPKQFLEDPEVRSYMEALQFNVFQLWQRTGGGTDLVEESIISNTTVVGTNSGLCAKIKRLTDRVEELENNDRSGEFKQGIARLNQRIDELIADLLAELKDNHRPDRTLNEEMLEAVCDTLQQIQLLNARVEDAFDTEIELEDLEIEDGC